MVYLVLYSGVVAGGGGKSPQMGAVGKLSENLLVVGKLSSKDAKFGADPPFWEKVKNKVNILSIHNFLCRKSVAVCRKIATSSPAYFFLTHDADGFVAN